MEEKFKLEINAVSPDGEAVNCNTNIYGSYDYVNT